MDRAMTEHYIPRNDHADESKWTDSNLIERHNDLVDLLDTDLMPRLGRQVLKKVGLLRYEIEMRIGDITSEDSDYELC